MTILNWTPPQPPGKDNCPYDHCTAETPFGRFLITWKGWKQDDSPTVDETPWGDWFGAFDDIEAAQQACEDEYCKRLQAALAEPEPEGPSFSDVMEWSHGIEPWATWLAPGGCLESAHFELDQLVTSAIARWGRPAPQPVPVSERLPGAEDCMANPRNGEGQWCWGWGQYSSSGPFSGRWRMLPRACIVEESTHWLPAHALPLPQPH